VTERRLEELVEDGLLWPRMSRSQPKWIAQPPAHREPTPPEGYVVSFICFHKRGFDVPTSVFMRALLHYYRVELHHLAPNAVAQAAIFAVVCEGYLGWSRSGICGFTSSRPSFLPRRRGRRGFGARLE
jgi:hypothetical protein